MRRVSVAALVLGVLGTPAAPAAPAAPATPAAPPRPAGYRSAPDARPVRAGAVLPGPGTYTDSIARGETRTYRVRLDGSSNVFLSAVLAPAPGSAVDVVDGVSLSLRTASGLLCGMRTDIRLYGDTPRPVADYVSRRVEAGRDCQEAGEYDLVVEGVGRGGDDGRRGPWRWDLELGYVVEPAPGPGDGPPPAPTVWSTEPPASFGEGSAGSGRAAHGGTGFNDAAPLAGAGTWRDELRPGESRFYRVPVAWGQQLFARARFGNAAAPPGRSALPDGLRLALYNPARGAVDERKGLYTGDPATLLLATAPAAYANRSEGATDAVSAMRFAGSYYLQVSLDRQAPTAVPIALDLALPSVSAAWAGQEDAGPARGSGPVFGSDSASGSGPVFGSDSVSGSGPGSRSARGDAAAPGPDPVLRAVGIAGISTGTVLVASLAAWPLLATRLSRSRSRARPRPRGRHARGA
ncbi:hypothetical protein [Streptomyces sp. NPDC056069]|uniref:hypothetical protein n=1 Tax=Streptomyces sp. NPDC056069 TaxID=3345702 RepID=UPI0035D812EC